MEVEVEEVGRGRRGEGWEGGRLDREGWNTRRTEEHDGGRWYEDMDAVR